MTVLHRYLRELAMKLFDGERLGYLLAGLEPARTLGLGGNLRRAGCT